MTNPPRSWLTFARRLIPVDRREEALGDLVELWRLRAARGERFHRLAFWRDVVSVVALRRRAREASCRKAPHMDILLTDMRSAWRSLRSSAGTTLLAFAILAVTIAAGTVTFSVVDAIALRPLPFAAPQELVSAGRRMEPDSRISLVTPQDYFNWREHVQAFSAFGAARGSGPLRVRIGGAIHPAVTTRVTVNLFDVLGVPPAAGRLFRAGDDVVTSDATVITDDYWAQAFGRDPAVVGQRLELENGSRQIVGVLPPHVTFPILAGEPTEVFVPYVASDNERSPADRGRTYAMTVVGRLRPGLTVAHARAEMESASKAMVAAFPGALEGRNPLVVLSLQDLVVGPAKSWLYLVLGAVGIVLAIGCVNVANLFLARATVRGRDVATRLALGASRVRLTRVLLIEGVLLSSAAAAAGIAVSSWGVAVVKASLPASLARTSSIAVDTRVLAVSVGVALLCGIAFAGVPAWWTSRGDLHPLTRAGNAGSIGGSDRLRSLKALLIAEIAFVATLLVASALLVTSFIRITTIDMGFDRHNVIVAQYRKDLGAVPKDEQVAAATTLMADALERVRRVHGVTSAAVIQNGTPLGGGSVRYGISLPGKGSTGSDMLEKRDVTPGYFQTMGLQLLEGRLFADADGPGAPRVALINDIAAQHFFGDVHAVGKTFQFRGLTTVVGVLRSLRLRGPEDQPRAEMYLPVSQSDEAAIFGVAFGEIVARIDGTPAAIERAVSEAVASVVGGRGINEPRLLDDDFRRVTADRRFNAGVMGIFGALAIAIGALGIYGTMAFLVAQRVREIGVRMALGASPAQVMRSVLRDAGWCVLTGLIVGLAAARAVSALFTSLVFGVTPTSPTVYVAVAVTLAAVAALAAYAPARRAARLDPLQALRTE